jgi:ribonuclease R
MANRRTLRSCLEQLVLEGKVRQSRHNYTLNPSVPKEAVRQPDNVYEGVLALHKRENLVLEHESLEMPIRIYPENSHHALPGDRVHVEVTTRRRGGKKVGKVIKILERSGLSFLFQVRDGKLHTRSALALPVKIEKFDKLKEGIWYKGLILPRISPRYYYAQVQGKSDGSLDLDLEDLLSKYSIPHSFSAEVEELSRKELADETERVDLLSLPSMTIDGADAKDFDDAISIRKVGQDYRLWVHIADVSHYVRENSPIDKEAIQRSTSIYFPEHVVPMLPEGLSNESCSLKPRVKRRALTCEMLFSLRGVLKEAWCYPSLIQSDRRFTYREVQDVFDGKLEDPLKPDLLVAKELHEILSARKRSDGAMDFELPEPKIILDQNYKVSEILVEERWTSHRLIEDFMVAANETIARFCLDAHLPVLYRHHPVPSKEKVEALVEVLRNLGIPFARKEYREPKTFQKLLDTVEPRFKNFVQPLVLRSMQKAIYESKHASHFGLARQTYCHFTSPIRRYPDLIVHRQLKRLFTLWTAQFPFQIFPASRWRSKAGRHPQVKNLVELGRITSTLERRAVQLERDYTQRKKVEYMSKKIGKEFQATVTGVTGSGIYCEIVKLLVEGFLPFENMPGYWTYQERLQVAHCSGSKRLTYRLGDPIEVKVQSANKEHAEIRFTVP